MITKENNFITGSHRKVNTRTYKNIARDKVVDFTLSYITQCNITKIKGLTLPGCWWRFEKQFLRRFHRSSFIGFENDPQRFRMAAMKIPKNNKALKAKHSTEVNGHAISNGKGCVIINGSIFDYLISENKYNQKYNFIWLDLEGPITEKLISSLSNLPNYLQDKAVIVLTVLAARESLKVSHEMNGDRIAYIKTNIPKLFNGEYCHLMRYNDNAPMIQCIYTV